MLDSPSISEKASRRQQRKAEKAAQDQRAAPLTPRNANQARLLRLLRSKPVVFAIGPAGTGKTYIGARHAVQQVMANGNAISQIVVTRPTAAEQRHRQGFLPGNINAKMKEWLIPIYDGLKAETSQATLDKWTLEGKLKVVAFEHMRGRTFANSVVLLDEAQNCSYKDLKTLITRMGEDSVLLVNGDPEQTDIDDSGLMRIVKMVEHHFLNAGVVQFSDDDVTRSAVAKEWVKAFRSEEGNFSAQHG